MIKGEKWVMGGKELWHLFFRKKALVRSKRQGDHRVRRDSS
jgi:hypothetical protein